MSTASSTAIATSSARFRETLSKEIPRTDALALLLSTPFLAALLVVLTFPIYSIYPGTGPDAGWQAAMYMAPESGLHFGSDVVFTYGPLGFLHVPIAYGEGLFALSLAFFTGIRFVLAASLLWTVRRALPLPLAIAACYLVLAVGHLNSMTMLLAFLWAFAAVGPESPRQAGRLLALAGGLLSGFEMLGKLNFGISVMMICFIGLAALPERRRNLATFALTFLGLMLPLWFATGQSLGNLPDYLSNSIQIVSGYSRAMGIDVSPRSPEILYALTSVAILLIATVFLTRRDPRRLRWASILLLSIFAFVCFKQDFVRRGVEGRCDFSLMMMAAAIAVAGRLPAGRPIPRTAMASVLIAPMLLFVIWANPTISFFENLQPKEHVVSFREDFSAVVDLAIRQEGRDSSREEVMRVDAVPHPLLRQIGDRTVAIEPWEIGVAWAYGLNWKPLPVIQDYAAYTPKLDRLNAAALEGAGPEMILRRNLRAGEHSAVVAVDERYPAWDGPAAKLALLCNYREVGVGGEWQLLEKTADRCGPVRSLGTAQAETGAAVEVPKAPGKDEIVFAKIGGLDPDLGETLEGLIYKAPNGWVRFDGRGAWNLDTATAGDGLIVSAPAGVDYRRPFQLAPDPRTLRVGIDGAGPRPITVSWYSRTVDPRGEKVAPRRAGSPPRAATAN